MSETEVVTVVVLQPGYLPWLGFFDQMQRCDVFVFYDDVQFDKGGWRHRNRIKLPGGAHWLTVPVRHEGRQRILDVEIDNSSKWARKHISTIRQAYAKTDYLQRYLPELENLLERRWERIADLDIAIVNLMCSWLGLHRQIVRSSEIQVQGARTERLLNLCLHFGANRYLTGDTARTYLDVEAFAQHGIEVQWQDYRHPTYKQQHGDFIPYLSALDLLLNCGDESAAIIASGGGAKS
jgi:hypothetical protein